MAFDRVLKFEIDQEPRLLLERKHKEMLRMSRTKSMAGWLRRIGPMAGLALVAAAVIYAAPQASGYHIIKRMPIGGEGGWDYMTVDSDTHRLYIARGSHFQVVDDTTGKVIGDIEIANTKNSHGLTLALDMGKGFTSNGDANTVSVVDLKTLKATSVIPIPGKDPDSIRYDAATKRVFTFNGKSADSTVIDATSGKVVGTVKLSGKPEEAILDGNGNMWVNIEDKSVITEFDTKTLAVKGSWPLAPCEGPSAMAYDSAHHRIFVACDKVMVVVNSDNGKVVASPPIGGDPDGNGFDPGTGLAFAACREGLVSVIHQDSPDKYTVVGNITTQFGTRTMALDLKTHRVYTETADFKPAGAPTPENPKPRPTPIAGSFVILEVGQ
jgi:DNA-binding beta-propeller fold protein YncE